MTKTDEIPCPDILGWGTSKQACQHRLKTRSGKKEQTGLGGDGEGILPGEMTLDARTEG